MNALIDTPEILDVPSMEPSPPDLKAEWMEHLAKGTCRADGLANINVPPHKPVVGAWFKEADLGFIFGARGLGKTWLGMLLARRCGEGGMMADWNVHRPCRVLYVDGEMTLDGIRERDAALTAAPAESLYYLQHEALFHLTGQVLNLTAPAVQTALLEKCKLDGIEILFLDNLSCLFMGMKENDADDWGRVLPWLLDLRRNGIAVVFITHAGRNGNMRGTSRREDAANWIINLTATQDAGEVQTGAQFVSRFVKNRNVTEADCLPLEWHFEKSADGTAKVSWKKLSTLQQFRQWIDDGLDSATEIADEMGISTGQVSKMAKRAMAAGWLAKDGKKYKLTGQA